VKPRNAASASTDVTPQTRASAVPYVLPFTEIDASAVPVVGGKGANLGVLTAAGFSVPPGFCVTTEAYKSFVSHPAQQAQIAAIFAELDACRAEDSDKIRVAGERMRSCLLSMPIPEDIERAVLDAFAKLGTEHAYAVRSSATAEDLPGASFAGQQDTYLNVIGPDALLDRMRACWASLFTDRAIAYRAKNNFDHRKVHLSVVVQRLIRPSTAGIMFSADPVTGTRHVLTIDAGYGLGEALVSGLVNADLYKFDKRTEQILSRKIADKRMAIMPIKGGGTEHVNLGEDKRHAQVLSDEKIIELAKLGAAVEKHYGKPQDMEWCIEDDKLYLVQARPITTLYPIPEGFTEPEERERLQVFVSFGHAQVMTDTMPTMGRSVWRRVFPFGRGADNNSKITDEAGSRLYLNPSKLLRIKAAAERLPKVLSAVDQQTADAVAEVVKRPAFHSGTSARPDLGVLLSALGFVLPIVGRAVWRLLFSELSTITDIVEQRMDGELASIEAELRGCKSTLERLKLLDDTLRGLFQTVLVPNAPYLGGGMLAKALLLKLASADIDPKDVEALDRGLPGNITTEMDLRIGDLADIARATPAVAEHLRTHPQVDRASIAAVSGSGDFITAFDKFVSRYGMRGGSEIDISRSRWKNDSRPIFQVIRGNLSRETAGAHRAHHNQMKLDGELAIARIVAHSNVLLRPLLRRLARAARAMFAIREHPKFQLVRVYGLLRDNVVIAGQELAAARVLKDAADVWHLSIPELIAACEGSKRDYQALVSERAQEFAHHGKLPPPRVITSEGEIVIAKREDNKELPAGALVGTGASAGVVEGIAKVVLDPNEGVLHAGEILIAPFTDPGWTPLFINAAGLVMEVGGMMTHGSVVAREYGIPAVVSVDQATTKIKTGQRIRVDGSRGIVELLGDAEQS
jgi:pyruvate,water dikinase